VLGAVLEDEGACAAGSESRFLRAMFNSSTVGCREGFSVAHGLFWKVTLPSTTHLWTELAACADNTHVAKASQAAS